MSETRNGSRYDSKRYGSQTTDTRYRSQFDDKRSMTEVLLESLSQGALRPVLSERPVGQRFRLGRIGGGIAVLLAAAAVGFVLFPRLSHPLPVAQEPVAVLEITRGSLGVFPASSDPLAPGVLKRGMPIYAGTVIDTRAAGTGAAALRLAGGGPSVRIDAGTRLEVVSSSSVRLAEGAVYIDSAAAGSAIEVRTTLGVVRDIGTQFEVRLQAEEEADEPSVRVRVREGLIILENEEGFHEADAGTELTMLRDGTMTRDTVPIYGPDWDWVIELAPIPDLEGQPLSAFFDWVTREGGWTVEFDSGETAELTSTIIMHGDARNLTLAEAASMVLSGSGLEYRVEEATFFVEPMASEETSR